MEAVCSHALDAIGQAEAMTVSRLSVDIAAPPAAVYAALADLPGYARWLEPSRTYVVTTDVADTPVKTGTTYSDHVSGNVMRGEVLECQPDRLLVFRQATKRGDLDITYLERAGRRVLAAPPRPGLERALAVAAAMVVDEQRGRTVGPSDGRTAPGGGLSPWVVESRRLGLRDDLE